MEQKDLIGKIIGDMDQKELVQRIVGEVMAKPSAGPACRLTMRGRQRTRRGPPRRAGKYIDRPCCVPRRRWSLRQAVCRGAALPFFSVCVNSCRVAYVARKLRGTGVKVCSVIGFPQVMSSAPRPSGAAPGGRRLGMDWC
jgi:hypothetical protein